MKLFQLIPALLLAGSVQIAYAAAPGASSSWPTRWCQAQPGMSKEQLVSVMGQPTRAFPNAMTWSDQHYQFNAFLQSDGKVKQLDINLNSLTETERSALQCEDVRTQPSTATVRTVKASKISLPACEIISPAEMSVILGAPVQAQASGRSKCVYKSSPSTGGPYVEFSVDRGDGKAAMQGAGFAGKHESGLSNPYDGIGDQAVAAGPALLIRTGDDLVTLVFSGVRDLPITAKKIFDIAKSKL